MTTVRPIVLAAAFAVASCGGGGSHVAFTPAPPPAPTPPPPPPPPPPPAQSFAPVIIFPNVTSSTEFATLGYQGLFAGGSTAASLIGSGFSVSYDAAAHDYVMDVPASQPGVFEAQDPNAAQPTGKLTDPSNPGQFQPITFGVGRSGTAYTAWAFYQKPDVTTQAGWMAFGLATPASGVPVTGSATYTAQALGYGGNYVAGRATLQFDFGAGTLGGTLDLWDAESDPGRIPLGHFDLTNTVVGSGSSRGQFSGDLSGGTQHGSFNGMFTGPNAEELMARWNATYANSDQVMYGIWVGKKN